MRSIVIVAIVLCCLGCSTSKKYTIHRLAPGMSFTEVKAVAGKMEWVRRTPKIIQYRGTFAKRPNCGLLCETYPVLLTFDKDVKLIDYRRDKAEELRRDIERKIRHIDSSDCDCDDDHDCNRRFHSYAERRRAGDDIYRAISGYGQALQSP